MKVARTRGSAGRDLAHRVPSGEKAVLSWCRDVVAAVNALEAATQARSDQGLRGRTVEFRSRMAGGESAASLLPEAFATVREAARRAVGQRHHDVQIMGGAVLHLGKLAEMRTGEGKTLTATLTAYLGALTGDAVHVMTANDYLASRDRDWMAPVYELLGLSVGLAWASQVHEPDKRRPEYAADITYGSWSRFCYDFLRDNLAFEKAERVQRGLALAIIDEADLVLIDEMRMTPQINGGADQPTALIESAATITRHLRPGTDYATDERANTVSLTDRGADRVAQWYGIDSLYDERNLTLAHLLGLALQAKELYVRDRDYVVRGDKAVLHDASGRVHQGRRYTAGVHEAIEAKERLPIRSARQMLAVVQVSDYVRQYDRVAAMTGTAMSDATLYRNLYHLEVVPIPTNKPMIRVDLPDVLYRTRQAKLAALAADVAARNRKSQPVLIGTVSADQAEAISGLLTRQSVPHEVLAARDDEREAEIIAAAGMPGAVTVAVRMAGRGVDIVLGGASRQDYDAVAEAGGLCVLGAERPGERRLELHMRGRAGRQGDPGESGFYLSTEDEIVQPSLKMTPSSLIRDGTTFTRLSAVIDRSQASFAERMAAWQCQRVAYDDVLAEQQRFVYADRRQILETADIGDRMRRIIDDVVRAEAANAIRAERASAQIIRDLRRLYPTELQEGDLDARFGIDAAKGQADSVRSLVSADAMRAYACRKEEVGADLMATLERRVLLRVTDGAWQDHLVAMADLLTGLTIRAAGGTVPLPEYQRESAALFSAMADAIRRDAVSALFYLKTDAGKG